MNGKKRNLFGRLAALLLALSLLCSCSLPFPSPDRGKQPPRAGYQHYTEESLKIQEAFDQATEDIFREEVASSTINLHYNLADPKAYGIAGAPVTFGDCTLASMEQDQEKLEKRKALLASIDPDRLSPDQQLTYRILEAYMDTELSSKGLELYAQPLAPTIGIQAQLPVLLAEYPFYNKEDVETYLALLSQIDAYYGQIMDFEREKAKAGLFMSDQAVDHVLESCQGYLVQPGQGFMKTTFDSRIDALAGLSGQEKEEYKAKNLEILKSHFMPAYQMLEDGLKALKGSGTNQGGLCHFPEGKKYYQYLVQASTGTSYDTVEDLKLAIKNQMDDDLNAMARILAERPQVIQGLGNHSFKTQDPNQILEDLKAQIGKDFPPLPPCRCTVKYVPGPLENSLSPAFYLSPPLDRIQDNVIYINKGTRFQGQDLYTTLAHEGYPGHLYQMVYFISHAKNNLRKILNFPGYSEGWATYVEYYAYTLDNGLAPGLGALLAHNGAVALALYATLDIAIHYDGWDQEQVRDYLSRYYNVDSWDVASSVYSALVENPANYLEYYVGYLEITNMKKQAKEALGKGFDLKKFHQFILDMGPAPFRVIKPYFKAWLVSSKINP